MRRFIVVSLFLSATIAIAAEEQKTLEIDWQPWLESIFEKARQEKRFVLLDLGGIWRVHRTRLLSPNVRSGEGF